MSDTPKGGTRRRIALDPVVPMFHVFDRPPGGRVEDGDRTRDRDFRTQAEATAWANARRQARLHIAKKRPDLSDKRAESAAFDIAEALYECADISPDDDAASSTDDESSSSPMSTSSRTESVGLTSVPEARHG